jgi:ribosome-associated heat shock protein Hsp15
MTDTSKIRLDKWLWAARFYKTRALAKSAVEGGKVHYDNQRSKPSRIVEIGKTIQLRQGFDEKIIIVIKISDKRLSATLAQALYQETAQSIEKREAMAQARQQMNAHVLAPQRRPDKKQRRSILKVKDQWSN